jgi:hypothetical protein
MPKRNLDEEEEFDDPFLLQQQALNAKQGIHPGKQKANIPGGHGQYRDIPHNIPQQPHQAEDATAPPVHQPIDRSLSIYELCMIGFFILFLVNCYIGKRTNENLAFRWYRANEELFKENYSHIGFEREYNVNTVTPILYIII